MSEPRTPALDADSTRTEEEGIRHVNTLPLEEATAAFLHACGSRAFAEKMAASRPFVSLAQLSAKNAEVWASLAPSDWDEAFRSHPEIGGKKAEGPQTQKSANWSAGEQSRVSEATSDTLTALAEVNVKYREKFGRIYIVCATGKTADEMLAIARARLSNEPGIELGIAGEEQRKITDIRLAKLVFGKR